MKTKTIETKCESKYKPIGFSKGYLTNPEIFYTGNSLDNRIERDESKYETRDQEGSVPLRELCKGLREEDKRRIYKLQREYVQAYANGDYKTANEKTNAIDGVFYDNGIDLLEHFSKLSRK